MQVEVLKDQMRDAGLSKEAINKTLAPLREPIFNKHMDKEDRYKQFYQRYKDVTQEVEKQLVEIRLSPEAQAAGFQISGKAKREKYLAKGGGSQGTVRQPANRGDGGAVTVGG
jgi:hypothetical protein